MRTHLESGQLAPQLQALALDGLREGMALLDFGNDAREETPDGLAARVHGTRRKLKWLRSVQRALRPALRESTFAKENRALRDAGRRLAAARSQVARRDCLLRLLRHYGLSASDVKQPVLAEPDAEVQLSAKDRKRAIDLMGSVAARSSDWLLAVDAPLLVTGIVDELRRARRAFHRAERAPSSHHVHEWRKHVKHHLHHLELVSELAPELGERISNLDGLSELLGHAHDLADLREALAADTDGPDLRALCDSREAELTLAALTRGRSLFALRPRELRVLLERKVRDS
jgi:hypothetical protein